MIESAFKSALTVFNNDKQTIDALWNEILQNYRKASRHYHNMQHLENLYQELLPVKSEIIQWHIMVLSLAYHDVVYSPLKQNNEEKSAALAVKRLREAGFKAESAGLVYNQILATRGHTISADQDTNFFTDADLAILGADPEAYQLYTAQIRKEYRLYPDLVYNPGRAKVLRHFLDMNRIFKTDFFYQKYEDSARRNLDAELSMLL